MKHSTGIELIVTSTEAGFLVTAVYGEEEVHLGHVRLSETDGTLQVFPDEEGLYAPKAGAK